MCYKSNLASGVRLLTWPRHRTSLFWQRPEVRWSETTRKVALEARGVTEVIIKGVKACHSCQPIKMCLTPRSMGDFFNCI